MDGNHDTDVPGRQGAWLVGRRHVVWLVAVLVIVLAAASLIVGRGDPMRDAVRVAVVGDSLTMQSSWAIDLIVGDGNRLVAVSGVNGATIADQHEQLLSYTGFDGASVLVAALGTNNAYFQGSDDRRRMTLEQTRTELDRAVTEVFEGPADRTWPLSVRCLVWVNVREDSPGLGLDRQAPAINQAIRDRAAAARQAGHQMLVADWAAQARGRDEWFVPDGVHLTEAGQRAYAALIAEAVDGCALE